MAHACRAKRFARHERIDHVAGIQSVGIVRQLPDIVEQALFTRGRREDFYRVRL